MSIEDRFTDRQRTQAVVIARYLKAHRKGGTAQLLRAAKIHTKNPEDAMQRLMPLVVHTFAALYPGFAIGRLEPGGPVELIEPVDPDTATLLATPRILQGRSKLERARSELEPVRETGNPTQRQSLAAVELALLALNEEVIQKARESSLHGE